MGQHEASAIEVSQEERGNIELIDFLYLDVGRLDSYISQMQMGTLTGVSKTIGVQTNSSNSYETGVKTALVGTFNSLESEQAIKSSTESYDPLHSKFIELFNRLDLQTLDFSRSYSAFLGVVSGLITIRDLGSISSVLPVVVDNKILHEGMTANAKNQLKAMSKLMNAIKPSLDMTLYVGDKIISGTLKEEYLSISVTDLVKNYGSYLPGEWFLIGVFDSPVGQEASRSRGESIELLVDMYNSAINGIYASCDMRVTPLAIFRVLNY